jgi:hypothetical protein
VPHLEWGHVCRALPRLVKLTVGSSVWGLLPESWAQGDRFRSLRQVVLYGDNRLHGLPESAIPTLPLFHCCPNPTRSVCTAFSRHVRVAVPRPRAAPAAPTVLAFTTAARFSSSPQQTLACQLVRNICWVFEPTNSRLVPGYVQPCCALWGYLLLENQCHPTSANVPRCRDGA